MIEQNNLFEILQQVLHGFSAILGDDVEIALHDMKKRELVYIINGQLTERQVGYSMDDSVYDTILSLEDGSGFVCAYPTHTPKGKPLRASHIVLRDDAGEPVALICINQDISKWMEFRSVIDAMIQMVPIAEANDPAPDDDNYIQKVTRQTILSCIEKTKPYPLETKDAKMDVLKKLESKGVFHVRDAVPFVCRALSISQATLYNYLRDIRNQDML